MRLFDACQKADLQIKDGTRIDPFYGTQTVNKIFLFKIIFDILKKVKKDLPAQKQGMIIKKYIL